MKYFCIWTARQSLILALSLYSKEQSLAEEIEVWGEGWQEENQASRNGTWENHLTMFWKNNLTPPNFPGTLIGKLKSNINH